MEVYSLGFDMIFFCLLLNRKYEDKTIDTSNDGLFDFLFKRARRSHY